MSKCALIVFLLSGLVGCGEEGPDCGEGMHRSGDGCAEDRVFGRPDTGESDDTGA
jgi:hypothetical protein